MLFADLWEIRLWTPLILSLIILKVRAYQASTVQVRAIEATTSRPLTGHSVVDRTGVSWMRYSPGWIWAQACFRGTAYTLRQRLSFFPDREILQNGPA